jgi:HD-GYP domain-containing protein (c-di-GMP phosphodiesterase class II)/CHASE2 domain-containing sensor protein
MLRGFVAGAAIGLAALLGGRTEPVRRLELTTVDARMRLAGPAPAPPVAIVGITQDDLRPEAFGPLPWSRLRYARAVDKLRRLGAKVIVFDLYFSKAANDPAEDAALARALDEAGNVILPVYAKLDPREEHGRLVGGVHWLGARLPAAEYLEQNIPVLAQAAATQGHINLSTADPDHLFRRVPAAIGFENTGQAFNALAVEAAAAAVAGPKAAITTTNARLEFAGRAWPLDESFPGCVPLDLSGVGAKVDLHPWRWKAPFGRERSIFLFSFAEFEREDFPAEAVEGRVVFVGGLLYERHPDVHPTPAGQQPGVILHALAVQSLLGARYPHTWRAAAQAGFTFALLTVVALVSWLLSFRAAALVQGGALVALAAVAAPVYAATGLLLHVAAPGLGLTAVFVLSVARWLRHAAGALRKRERELDTLVEMGRISASLVGASPLKRSNLLPGVESDVLAPPLGAGVNGAAEVVAATIGQIIGAGGAACYLVDRQTGELAVAAVCGAAGDDSGAVLDVGTTAARQALRERRPILWQDHRHNGGLKGPGSGVWRAKSKNHHPPSAAAAPADGSLLCVPMTLAGRVAGAMAFFNKQPSPVSPEASFTSDDLRLVTTFTHQAAVTLENARLYQSMHTLFLEAIKSLAAAIDAKDPYTRGHTARVAQFCTLLGRQMSLSEAEVQVLHLAATLHDIGKIAIPEAVLNKPTSLTEDERRIIQKHPVRGAIILEPVHQLRPIIPGIRHHHEAYDGAGYPDGLAGENIPLLARVIAIADSFDAMTTDRPYRRARTDAEALEEVGRCAGTQFDPALADLFIARFHSVRPLVSAALV